MKTCRRCTTEKPISAFGSYSSQPDGLNPWCKDCVNAYSRKYKADRAPKVKEWKERAYKKNRKQVLAKTKAYAKAHPEQVRETLRRFKDANPEKVLLYGARARAKALGIPCTITTSDIVISNRCPILDIELVRRRDGKGAPLPSSPTLDRVDPRLGYVPGNVAVISARANGLKNGSTPEELERILAYVRAHHG